jgi:hypothetical protein
MCAYMVQNIFIWKIRLKLPYFRNKVLKRPYCEKKNSKLKYFEDLSFEFFSYTRIFRNLNSLNSVLLNLFIVIQYSLQRMYQTQLIISQQC